LAASVAQFVIGPLVLLTLPTKGFGWNLVLIIAAGASVALPAIWWMWKGINGEPEHIGKNFGKVVVCLTITVLFMGSGRHVYRANALEPHRNLVKAKTKQFKQLSKEARENPVEEVVELAIDTSLGEVAKGAAIFTQYCTACHKKDEKLVGPPMTEMVSIYRNDIEGLKKWILQPGKKRPDYPQMPGFPQLSDDDRAELAKYILSIK